MFKIFFYFLLCYVQFTFMIDYIEIEREKLKKLEIRKKKCNRSRTRWFQKQPRDVDYNHQACHQAQRGSYREGMFFDRDRSNGPRRRGGKCVCSSACAESPPPRRTRTDRRRRRRSFPQTLRTWRRGGCPWWVAPTRREVWRRRRWWRGCGGPAMRPRFRGSRRVRGGGRERRRGFVGGRGRPVCGGRGWGRRPRRNRPENPSEKNMLMSERREREKWGTEASISGRVCGIYSRGSYFIYKKLKTSKIGYHSA